MKIGRKTIVRSLSHIWAGFRGNDLSQKYVSVEQPLRSELFSSSQMERHGKTLAVSHTLSPGHGSE
ncbi:MAG: putative protein NdvB, partial [Deltaproteobacteria bacterium]|nr:putative protein NdvB [Deltaproteobacteria bacterium]